MKTKLFYFFAFLGLAFVTFISLHNVLSGSSAFWYDPARDMLSAWDNLSKITLIGPISGIPGIFYGPYWIWWLSFGEIISKNPEVVILITTTIPYLIFYTFLWYLFSKIIGRLPALLVYSLYFYSFQGQITSLWNPNLAPLLFLSVLYLLTTFHERKTNSSKLLQLFASGVLSGLALNIHISFSTGFIFGCLIYLITFSFLGKEKLPKRFVEALINIIIYLVGLFISFAPFFLFEIRHGFSQTKTLLNAISHGGGVVALQGLTKIEILQNFIGKFAALLQLPNTVAILIFAVILVIFISVIVIKKIKFTDLQVRLLSLTSIIALAVLLVYLTAKNPIWPYHFIGFEIIFSIFIALILSKIKWLQYYLIVWIGILAILQIQGVINSFQTNPLLLPTLYTKEVITKTVVSDAKNKTYTMYAYNSAIYMYDYAYLFRWMGNKTESYDPGHVVKQGIVYLILSPGKQSALIDFIHFRSPDNVYTTTKTWHFPDGTIVLRRSPKPTI